MLKCILIRENRSKTKEERWLLVPIIFSFPFKSYCILTLWKMRAITTHTNMDFLKKSAQYQVSWKFLHPSLQTYNSCRISHVLCGLTCCLWLIKWKAIPVIPFTGPWAPDSRDDSQYSQAVHAGWAEALIDKRDYRASLFQSRCWKVIWRCHIFCMETTPVLGNMNDASGRMQGKRFLKMLNSWSQLFQWASWILAFLQQHCSTLPWDLGANKL